MLRTFLAAILVLGLLTGCGGKPTGTVTGKVYYKDKLVSNGKVEFVGEKDVGTAEITADGSYNMEKAPVGTVKVGVSTFKPIVPPQQGGPSKSTKGKGGAAGADWVDIPQKYRDPTTSGVTTTVRSGTQEFDIRIP